jgi:hypothetical protein
VAIGDSSPRRHVPKGWSMTPGTVLLAFRILGVGPRSILVVSPIHISRSVSLYTPLHSTRGGEAPGNVLHCDIGYKTLARLLVSFSSWIPLHDIPMFVTPASVFESWPALNYANPVKRSPVALSLPGAFFLSIATTCLGNKTLDEDIRAKLVRAR